MTNEELIAKARELCEEQIAVEKYIIRQQKSDDLISRSVRESAQKRLNSWTTHLAEMDEHTQQVRYLSDEIGGSYETPEEALEWSGEKDAEYEEAVKSLSTFTICKKCGEDEEAFAEHLGIDEWTYSPSIYGGCPKMDAKAKRLLGVE